MKSIVNSLAKHGRNEVVFIEKDGRGVTPHHRLGLASPSQRKQVPKGIE